MLTLLWFCWRKVPKLPSYPDTGDVASELNRQELGMLTVGRKLVEFCVRGPWVQSSADLLLLLNLNAQ